MTAEDLDYNRLPIPFRCVATDLNTLASVTLCRRPAPPGGSRLYLDSRRLLSGGGCRTATILVDGGIVDNLPTDVLRRDLHADAVIAVHLE